MFPITDALKNIYRQRKRYRIFISLLLLCALLSGVFLSVAVPCRLYSDRVNGTVYSEEEAMQIQAMDDNVRQLGQTAAMVQIGILLVGAAAVFYVSALMIGERFYDIGILFSIGLSKGQIFLSLFTEMFTVCLLSLGGGLVTGSSLGRFWLRYQIGIGILPEGLSACMDSRAYIPVCIAAAAGILLIPLIRLVFRLLRTDPTVLLRDRT